MHHLLILVLWWSKSLYTQGYLPIRKISIKFNSNNKAIISTITKSTNSEEQDDESNYYFDSKLVPPISKSEIEMMLNELNVTGEFKNIFGEDKEMSKWKLSKKFFEQFAFNNYTERYNRTVMDVKTDFYGSYRKIILPNYKTFISDMIYVTHVNKVDARFIYDALFAFGLCTQYYTVMKGYALVEEIDPMFDKLMTALQFDPVKIREDARKVLNLVKESTLTESEFLNQQEGEIGDIFDSIRNNRFFKYTEAFGVGLARIMELRGVEPNPTSFERWSNSLEWVPKQRLISTWSEFCQEQLKMQQIETMQKQILIREKRRQAENLERKAAKFASTRKALEDLNQLITLRRAADIETAKKLKQEIEPDEYEKIMQQSELNENNSKQSNSKQS